MRVVVTGSAGFIGQHTVKELERRDYEVFVVDIKNEADPIDFTASDFKDCLHENDKVLHLGAVANFHDAEVNPQLAVRTNVEGTLNIIKACIEKKVERLVYSSTGSVFDPSCAKPVTEDAVRNPSSIYGLTKKQAEDWIFQYGKKKRDTHAELPYIILRYPYIYGVGKDWGAIGAFIKRIKNDQPPIIFGGNQTNDFVYIKDVVTATLLALESPHLNQVYNIGSGQEITIETTAQLCLEMLDSKLQIEYHKTRSFDPTRFIYDSSHAQKLLGFKAKWNLKDGLKDMLQSGKE